LGQKTRKYTGETLFERREEDFERRTAHTCAAMLPRARLGLTAGRLLGVPFFDSTRHAHPRLHDTRTRADRDRDRKLFTICTPRPPAGGMAVPPNVKGLHDTRRGPASSAPWWDAAEAPQEVLVLRATLHQRMHEFDVALADLARVLNVNPRNAQARLMRATVLQVQGVYDKAREECRKLQDLAQQLVWTACLASVNGANGRLRESYEQLRSELDAHPGAQPRVQSWLLTSLAEMAARAGMAEAEADFRRALALDSADYYLLGAYADYLLDIGRPEEVLALLQDKTAADPLLLRYALALQAQHSDEVSAHVEQLRARFAASRLRGDRVHLREEARFTLHLLNAPTEALKLAEENWQVQKEAILLEAALVARDTATVDAVREWLNDSRLEDLQLQRILAPRG
jgi:Tfp pilus assembly protein PilF